MNLNLTSSRIALAALGALALSPAAFAQSDRDDTVVVTGSATPIDYEKMGQSITVIDADLIEDQGYTFVADVLRQVPGVAMNRAGAPGGLTQARIRGAEANHTLVLLDGIDISSPDQGETDFSTLLTADLDRIEILRGPQSGLYGSNALAGVVNLVSRREIDGHYVGASLEGGSFNTVEAEAFGGIGDGDNFATISLVRLTSDGYDISPDQTANGVPAVGVGGTPGDEEGNEITTLNLRGGVRLSDMLHLNGVVRYSTKKADLDGQAFGFPIPGRTYDDASSTEHEQTLIGASATLDPFGGAWETVFSASHVDESRRSTFTDFPFLIGPPAPSPDNLLLIPLTRSGTDARRTTYGVKSTWSFGPEDFRSFLTGFAEAEEEEYSDAYSARVESRSLAGVGLQYRAEIARQLYLTATLRHDDNDAFQDADTWSVSGSWAIPDTGARLHASAGTGVTNPTFIEQFGFDPGSFIGNPNLVPEEALGWDAGVEQTLFGGNLVLDLTWFSSELENEIFTAFTPTFESTPLNSANDSSRKGWELTVSATPIDDLSLYGSYTRLDAVEPAGVEIRRPEEQAALDARWTVLGGPVQLNLGVSWTGETWDTDFSTFSRTRVDPYALVRLGASWQVDEKIELYARVENLLDETYEEVIGYLGAPQGVYLGLRFRDEVRK